MGYLPGMPGMTAGPMGGQLAWQQTQTPATMYGLNQSAVSLQGLLGESNQTAALTNSVTTASGRWGRLQQMAAFSQSITQMAMKFARGVGTSLLSDASEATQAMSKF